MPQRNEVSYAAMVTGFVRSGKFDKAEMLYVNVPAKLRDPVCSNALIGGYLKTGRFEEAVKVFKGMVVRNVVSWSLIVDGYCKEGRVVEAREVFDIMLEKNVVTWTTMIDGYMKVKCFEDGFGLLLSMRRGVVAVSSTTLTVMFEACGSFCRLWEGLQVHGLFLRLGFDFDIFPGNSVVKMYCRFGFLNNGEYEEDFRWFIEMLQKGIRPNEMTFSAVLSASAGLATLIQGSQIHAYVVKLDMEFDLYIQTSLVSMYSRCGSLTDAYRIFLNMKAPNSFSFNTMITGFAQNGFGDEALYLFRKMENEGLEPNQVTFLSVLSACAHVGLVDEGLNYFKSMKSLYNIEPGPNHYACMVDILGRARSLDDAIDLIYK
ncbi:hypothetical protein Pint_04915 [Pistacia integerrima]|uniref:Uncharacterized protein n=1 Tax=Pistacia integerrima TaxID=434235 RepID=A0ACC0Z7Q6_9ROSI|nr:hypothetical protein Pint_04915 [Pistacia integerrima]